MGKHFRLLLDLALVRNTARTELSVKRSQKNTEFRKKYPEIKENKYACKHEPYS